MNGGYYINGVPYMACKITGEPVRNVSIEAKSVIGSKALQDYFTRNFLKRRNHLTNQQDDQLVGIG